MIPNAAVCRATVQTNPWTRASCATVPKDPAVHGGLEQVVTVSLAVYGVRRCYGGPKPRMQATNTIPRHQGC
jgi:hypothetical protein